MGNISVAVCAIAKNENRYIREWVEHYKNLGVDKIYLYDNNDVDGEKFEDVIGDYIKSHFVKLTNFRGKTHPQIESYMDCYRDYKKYYDWMIFVDCDEFLILNGETVKEYLSDPVFEDYATILVNWKLMNDNNLVHYENKPVMERFTNFSNSMTEDGFYSNNHVKSIINCHKDITRLRIHIHDIKPTDRYCNSSGKPIDSSEIDTWRSKITKPVYDRAYIKHFATKTVEEFCMRRVAGTRAAGIRQLDYDRRVKQFFSINERTDEKEKIFAKYKRLAKNR